MSSVSAIIRKRPNAKGEYPLYIQVIKDRRPSLKSLGYAVEMRHWDDTKKIVKKSHPNSARLNNLIAKKISELSEKKLELEGKQKDISATEIVHQETKSKKAATFNRYSKEYLLNLEKTKQWTRYGSDKSKVKNFKEFLKDKDIALQEITPSLLRKFGSFMKGKKEVSERTVMNNFVVIRCIIKMAIADKVMDNDFYPFGRGKIIIKFPQSQKIGLTKSEIYKLEAHEPEPQSSAWHAKNLWLLSYNFAGVRASDIIQLRWSDIMDGRLYYQMNKNSKPVSLKIFGNALVIIESYQYRKDAGEEYVFPFLDNVNEADPKDLRRKIVNAIGLCNKYLKRMAKELGIEKTLTMHIARHTFGNVSGDRIPIQMLQKLYRHSSITTTIGYQNNFMFDDADEALQSVIEG